MDYKLLKITDDVYAKIDTRDYEKCRQYNWWLRRADKYTYPMTTIGRKSVGLHRVVLGLENAPKTTYIDHINGDMLDNRRENLRVCTNAQNQWNVPKKSTSKQKYKGIRETKYGTYEVRIRHLGKRLYLGTYKTEIEAVDVYNRKARELHGEFAYINEIIE